MFWEIDFIWEADVNRGSGRDPKKIGWYGGLRRKRMLFRFYVYFMPGMIRVRPIFTDSYRYKENRKAVDNYGFRNNYNH